MEIIRKKCEFRFKSSRAILAICKNNLTVLILICVSTLKGIEHDRSSEGIAITFECGNGGTSSGKGQE